MTSAIQITLKAGERIFLNGAVVRVDRKVTLELLNEVAFLLEGHVLQPEQTTTPLRQIYFVVQTMLMDPNNAGRLQALFADVVSAAKESFRSGGVPQELEGVSAMVEDRRLFDALRALRALFPVEDAIMTRAACDRPAQAENAAAAKAGIGSLSVGERAAAAVPG